MTDGVTSETTDGNTTLASANKPGTPWWRPIVNELDRRVTPPANRLVRANIFADTVAVVTRLEVRWRRRIERQSTWLLHQYNLPAADDARKMTAQVAALEARLRDLTERLEDRQHETPVARSSGQRATVRTRSTGASDRE